MFHEFCSIAAYVVGHAIVGAVIALFIIFVALAAGTNLNEDSVKLIFGLAVGSFSLYGFIDWVIAASGYLIEEIIIACERLSFSIKRLISERKRR